MNDLTFVVTKEEANTIGIALAELPFKVSAGLVQKLSAQAKAQLEPKDEKPAEQ